jgi:hypothetical protein
MASVEALRTPGEILARVDKLNGMPDGELAAAAPAVAQELLELGEALLECWLVAHGATPTLDKTEGFRLLALHRQGARDDPTFNACRETCRELVYYHNLVRLYPAHAEAGRRARLGAMVARHLVLFVGGKLEVAGLGDFCCASRPLREQEQAAPPTAASV